MEPEGDGRWLAWGERRHGLVIYDAPKREVTALARSADGRLYVAAVGEKTRSPLPPLPVQGVAVATATITIVTPGSVQASSSNGLIPDGSEWFLVTQEMLLALTHQLNAVLVDPLKTTIVQNHRCMTTWVLRKPAS